MLANYYERPPEERIAVLGTGVVSAPGVTLADYWKSVCAGELPAKLKTITLGDKTADYFVAGFPDDGFGIDRWMSAKQKRRVDLYGQFSVAAGIPALMRARLLRQTVKPSRTVEAEYELLKVEADRAGVVMGIAVGGSRSIEKATYDFLRSRHDRVHPLTIPHLNPATGATVIGELTGMTALQYTLNSACTSGLLALEAAASSLQTRRSKVDVVVAGATESADHMIGLKAFEIFGAMSPNNMAELVDVDGKFIHPSRSLRKDAQGLVMGRGAGVLVLSRLDYALANQLPIMAEFAGCYSFTDPRDELDPTEANIAKLLRGVLLEADLESTDVDEWSIHAAGTTGDAKEINGGKIVFGNHAPNVTVRSDKLSNGHSMGPTAAIGAVEVVQSIITNTIPHFPYDNLIDAQGFDFPRELRHKPVRVAIKSALGLMGQYSAGVFVEPDPKYVKRVV